MLHLSHNQYGIYLHTLQCPWNNFALLNLIYIIRFYSWNLYIHDQSIQILADSSFGSRRMTNGSYSIVTNISVNHTNTIASHGQDPKNGITIIGLVILTENVMTVVFCTALKSCLSKSEHLLCPCQFRIACSVLVLHFHRQQWRVYVDRLSTFCYIVILSIE